MKKNTLITLCIILALACIGLIIQQKFRPSPSAPTPAPSQNPYPTSPVIADRHDNIIKLEEPLPHTLASSPLLIKGKARGQWYFEASFPVILKDANGKIIAQAPAQAQGEWMTTEFVPFTATLTFSKPATTTGTLILQKDNPSGLPENDDSIEIPLTF